MKTKVCAMCGLEKSVDKFYQRKGTPWYSSRCRECDKLYAREYNKIRKQRREEKELEMEEQYPELTVFVAGCNECMFKDDCIHLVMERGTDPYCFVSSRYHSLFVQYAEVNMRRRDETACQS